MPGAPGYDLLSFCREIAQVYVKSLSSLQDAVSCHPSRIPVNRCVLHDLCDDQCTVNRFLAQYWAYVNYLRRRHRTKRIVMLKILHRQETIRYRMNMTVAEYSQKVDSTNTQLKRMCARSTNIVFWQHNKHVRLPAVISRDGVHQHSNAMKKYWRSVRGAVMRAVRR